MTTNLCHSVVRSLDVLKTLSVDHQLQVHRKLVSFISKFKPQHDIFTQVPRSDPLDIKAFEDEGWQPTGDEVPSPNSEPKKVVAPLEHCPIQNRTLSGWLRAAVAQPQAEPQTRMSQNWPIPTAEIWPPGSISGATPPAIRGDPHGSSLEEQPVHDSASASSVCARSDGPRLGHQENVALDEQDQARARALRQALNSRFLSTRRADSHTPMEMPLSHQSDVLPDDEHQRPSEQPMNNEAVYTPATPHAAHQTVTVNFLYDGARPFDKLETKASTSFLYLSYREVPTSLSICLLIRRLRLEKMSLGGVTVIFKNGMDSRSKQCVWSPGLTFFEGTWEAGMTLAEVGWGSTMDSVWLAVAE